MKQKRRVINFILSVVCCLCVFFGSGMESRAAEEDKIYADVFYHGGVNYVYSYTDYLKFGNHEVKFSKPVYVCICRYGINGNFAAMSKEAFTYEISGIATYGYAYAEAYDVYFLESYGTGYDNTFNIPINEHSDPGSIINAYKSYCFLNDFEFYQFIPDFDNYYHEDTDRWINDMRAELKGNILYATWNGLGGSGLHVLEGYENTYIQVHIMFKDDKGTADVYDDSYSKLFDFFTPLSPNEFSIDITQFDIPAGHDLWMMIANPYWYFNDDINSTLFKGKQTYMFFDESGISDYPLIKDTADIYNPLDPNLSNWNAITNFTGDYFYNMGNVMNQTFNNWDSSGMDASNVKLNNSLSGFSQQEDVIFNQVSNNLNGFEFDNYLSFGDKVTNGISFGAGLINKFFEVSGDLTILFVVGCVMVFVFIVVGIWRFSK